MTKEEQAKLQIDFSKIGADEQKYFDLFDKHIPENVQGNVLIYDISNLGCIYKILQKNPEAKYFIYGNESVNKGLKLMISEFNVRFLDKDPLYNINNNMKFDLVIMNPPYQKNLHLKILAEAIKHLKDDDSICVNLSPVLWIEDPHAHKKQKSNLFKFKQSIIDKCDNLEVIDSYIANEQFGIAVYSNLGIYTCKNITNGIDSLNFWKRNFENWEVKIFENIYAMPTHIADKCDSNKRDGIRVPIAFIAGNRGTLPIYKDITYVIDGYNKDGIDWTKCKNNGGYEKPEGIPIPVSIKFNSEIEAQNFYNSWKTTFCKWLSKRFLFDQNIQLQFLPWMSDYSQPWTDERFYKFFNLTKDEIKIIEEMMAKYK